MSATMERTVRELALESPATTRVFEKMGIDYCCGGGQSLEQACRKAKLPVDQVLDALEMAAQLERAAEPTPNWWDEPLSELIAHIKRTHHAYTRTELARLRALLEKVCSAHGKNHRELLQIRTVFGGLAQELTMHMMKEEMVLFPYIERLEEARIQKETAVPPPFGKVQNPIAMMEHEHDSAGNALRTMREASAGYQPPADACVSYQTLYRALAEFEADMHQHIHLENNVLFPRAIEMENLRATPRT